MRCRWTLAPGLVAACALGLLTLFSSAAQSAPEPPSASVRPPRVADAPAPFQAIGFTLPEPLKDPSFEAFRAALVQVAEKKDREALGRLIVSKGFFWERESGNGADPKKSGLANFAAAIALDNSEDPETGWDAIAIYAEDPTVFGLSDRQGVVCGPADPSFDEDAFQKLLEASGTDVGDWVYPVTADVALRAEPRSDAPAVEKIGLYFVRVLAAEGPANAAAAEFFRVALPSGKVGFVALSDIASLGVSQFCYVKEGGAWKITGVLGGVE